MKPGFVSSFHAFALKTLLLITACVATLDAVAADRPSYASKLSFRTGNGIIQNTVGAGSSLSLGGFNVLYNFFFNSQIAVGVGYFTDPPLHGFNLSVRYYFHGQGTRSTTSHRSYYAERHDNVALYAGIDIAQRNYSYSRALAGGLQGPSTSGNSGAINLAIGGDVRLSQHFELTAEANMGITHFTASDPNIKLKGTILHTGISYVW